MTIQDFIFKLINAGFSVKKSGHRYYADCEKTRLEILSGWDGQYVPHVGRVDTHGSRGKWVVIPQPLSQEVFEQSILE